MGAKDQRIYGKESRWAAIFDKASSYNGMKKFSLSFFSKTNFNWWFSPISFFSLWRVLPHHSMKMPMTLISLSHNQMKKIIPPPLAPQRKHQHQAFGKRLQILSIEFYSYHCFSSIYSWSLTFYRRTFSAKHHRKQLKLLDIKILPSKERERRVKNEEL